MNYVMSDIHGEYYKLIKMLKLINFSDEDNLYILGDIFDRGNKPLQIYSLIKKNKNITLLKGNHEKMFVDAYDGLYFKNWLYNGGYTTYLELQKQDPIYINAIKEYFDSLPVIKVIDKFILVHSNFYLPQNQDNYTLQELIDIQDEEYNLWDRSWLQDPKKYKDYTIICGHTPVGTIINDCKEIIKLNGHIVIDCGATFSNGQLACLRLDDMQEFYI